MEATGVPLNAQPANLSVVMTAPISKSTTPQASSSQTYTLIVAQEESLSLILQARSSLVSLQRMSEGLSPQDSVCRLARVTAARLTISIATMT